MTDTRGIDYTGPSGIARDSQWLTNEDIPHDKDTIVEIERVILHQSLTLQGGRQESNKLALQFVGKKRQLLLNATNRKTMNLLFNTNKTGEWWGKRIMLGVEQNVRRPDGSKGPAVRIRAKRVEQAKQAEQADQVEPGYREEGDVQDGYAAEPQEGQQ